MITTIDLANIYHLIILIKEIEKTIFPCDKNS